MIRRQITRVLILLGALTLNACMTPQIQIYQQPAPAAGPQTVAVLPFTLEVELDEGEHPEIIFRRVFYNYFSYLGYRDLPPEEVDRRLARAGHTHPYLVQRLDAAELRRLLGVDAVVMGRVLDANNFTGGVYAETRLEAELQLRDLRTGRTLWKLEHHEIDMSGIAQATVVNMVQDQVDNSETGLAYYRAAEVFAVKAMEQIPDPGKQTHPRLEPPVIRSLQANVRPRQVLQPGDVIEVRLEGPAGLKASFDIGNVRTYLAMQEVRPGVYQGSYRIRPEDRMQQALIIGRLEDRQGLVGKKIFQTLIHFEQV